MYPGSQLFHSERAGDSSWTWKIRESAQEGGLMFGWWALVRVVDATTKLFDLQIDPRHPRRDFLPSCSFCKPHPHTLTPSHS